MAELDRKVFNALSPDKLTPHGDRYIVEIMDVANVHVTEDGKTEIEIAGTESIEEKNGYFIARIIAGGDGYRMESDVTVRMPYGRDDVVMVERFSGRELLLQNRKYKVVNQIDILARVDELSPDRTAMEVHIEVAKFIREKLHLGYSVGEAEEQARGRFPTYYAYVADPEAILA